MLRGCPVHQRLFARVVETVLFSRPRKSVEPHDILVHRAICCPVHDLTEDVYPSSFQTLFMAISIHLSRLKEMCTSYPPITTRPPGYQSVVSSISVSVFLLPTSSLAWPYEIEIVLITTTSLNVLNLASIFCACAKAIADVDQVQQFQHMLCLEFRNPAWDTTISLAIWHGAKLRYMETLYTGIYTSSPYVM